MAYQSFNGGEIRWPLRPGAWTSAGAATLDTANDAVALIGRLRWSDGGSHTVDTSGSSKIYVHTSTVAVFDDATSVMHIGIQDVDTTTGSPGRPDGTYDVHSVVTTAADTSPALTTISSLVAATPTTGTKTMSHGDLISVVVTLVTVGSSPAASVSIMHQTNSDLGGSSPALPFSVSNTSGSWAASSSGPVVLIVASDGTYGTLDGVGAIGQFTTVSFSDSTNPDENGNIFQVPFACKASGIMFAGAALGATGDFQYDLTSTPLGTPASLISGPIAIPAESVGGSTTAAYRFLFPAEVALAANTDYCVSIKATAAGNVSMYGLTLPNAGARVLMPGGTTTFGATRNGGSGAYSTSSTVIRAICVLVSAYEISAGGGSGTHFSIGG
jgi:hypothetical protein